MAAERVEKNKAIEVAGAGRLEKTMNSAMKRPMIILKQAIPGNNL